MNCQPPGDIDRFQLVENQAPHSPTRDLMAAKNGSFGFDKLAISDSDIEIA